MRNYVNKREIIQRLLAETEQSRSYCIHINTIKRLLDDIDALSDKEIRNMAIEEFAEKLYEVSESIRPVGWSRKQEIVTVRRIKEIAEQMKEGGK